MRPQPTNRPASAKAPGVLSGLLLGAHFSIAGGLHRALYTAREYGCDTLQIFTKNASTWREKHLGAGEISRFDQARKDTRISRIASHTSYLINLATDDHKKHRLSCEALKNELLRSHQLGIPCVVHHPGAHMGQGEAAGLRKVAASINRIFDQTGKLDPLLLLETTAGQGTVLGHKFEQLAAILAQIRPSGRVGVCLDTCHIFAAGYDIRSRLAYHRTIEQFDRTVGLKRLHLIHLNDAKRELGSRVDRHQHIGEGAIGIDAFSLLMNDARLRAIPKILETPKGKGSVDFDSVNLARLRSLIG